MKVTKIIHFDSQEVEIDVTGAELWQALWGEFTVPEQVSEVKNIANHISIVFRRMPDALIAELNEPTRKIISDFFQSQAERFKP